MTGKLHQIYGAAVGLAGLFVLFYAGLPSHYPYLFLSFIAVVIVVRYHLRLAGDLTYSLATPLIVGGAVLCGMAGGIWLAGLDALLRIAARRDPRWWRIAFTTGQAALCATLATYVYRLVNPAVGEYTGGALATAVFLACNLVLFAAMVFMAPDKSTRAAFGRTAVGATEMQLLEVVAGGLLVGLLEMGNAVAVGLMIVILIMFSLSVRRVSDAQFQSRSDPLTKLWNLRGFADDFQDALDRFFIAKSPFGIIVLDLDHFKEVNDTHGHDVGNDVLRVVADRLHHHVRQVDGIYRIGGEEFAVILPDIRRSVLEERAAQLEATLRDEPVRLDHAQALTLSASVGFALCPVDGEDYESLFRHADQAMYAIKQARNKRNQQQLDAEETSRAVDA